MNYKIPRKGTRVRALFDELCRKPSGAKWGDLKDAYDSKHPAYSHSKYGQRYYSSMTVSDLLRKFCTYNGPKGKRRYTIKPEWAKAAHDSCEFLRDKGFAEFQLAEMAKPVLSRSIFRPGDRVRLVNKDSAFDAAFKANGLTVGHIYEVSHLETSNGQEWVHVRGANGGWYDRHFELVSPWPVEGPHNDKGAPEIRDMAWSENKPAPKKELVPEGFSKALEPKGYPVCHCGMHTWSHLTNTSNPKYEDILYNVRQLLMSVEGYSDGHFSNRPCKNEQISLDEKDKQIKSLAQKISALEMIISNKNHHITMLEKELTEVRERSSNRQKLIDDTAAENMKYQERLEDGKTAIDTARSMLADILVGAINEAPRAIEELDAQLASIYGVLDGTMD